LYAERGSGGVVREFSAESRVANRQIGDRITNLLEIVEVAVSVPGFAVRAIAEESGMSG
jgi:hypothetical protein